MAMNAGELRTLIADLPDDTLIVLSSDAEGNSYSPLDAAELSTYDADTTWSGEVYHTQEEWDALSEDDKEQYRLPPDSAVPAVVLWPIR